MMRSLSSAVAGLRTHQTKMDVIGNNIANVNTYGFKASRTTFQDVYYQNLAYASSANGAISGGTNPTQIGYGSSVATIDLLITQSGNASTDRALDVYIGGDGFITGKDSSGQLIYTRLGNLRFDGSGNLVDGMGNFIQGFPMDETTGKPIIGSDGKADPTDLERISCTTEILDKLTGISINPSGTIVGILPGEAKLTPSKVPEFIDEGSLSIPPDSVLSGNVQLIMGVLPSDAHVGTALGAPADIKAVEFGEVGLSPTYTKTDGSVANITYSLSSTATGEIVLSGTIPAADPTNDPPIEVVRYSGQYNQSTKSVELKSPATSKVGMKISFNDSYKPVAKTAYAIASMNEAADGTASPIKYQITTSDKGGNVVKIPADNGEIQATTNHVTAGTAAAPTLLSAASAAGLTINVTGTPTATAVTLGIATTEEGEHLTIGNLVLAKFRNSAGLEGVGDGYFAPTFNSGEATYVKPGLEGTGGLQSGYLEMSNVDLSKEFTDMITTQRGFQSNSRIVTVSDEMLQELVNLKR